MSEVATVLLTADQARTLTEEVKADTATLWSKLLQLYEGEAHKALGYSSWKAYYADEFGEDPSRGHQILNAARVRGLLEGQSTNVDPPQSEGVARELAPLLEEPQKLQEVWSEAVEQFGDRPTAKQVREVRNGDGPVTEVEKVTCPTCGHKVRPDDFKRGV